MRELIGHGQYAKPEAIKQPGSNEIIALSLLKTRKERKSLAIYLA